MSVSLAGIRSLNHSVLALLKLGEGPIYGGLPRGQSRPFDALDHALGPSGTMRASDFESNDWFTHLEEFGGQRCSANETGCHT